MRALAVIALVLTLGGSAAEAGRQVSPARARAVQALLDVVKAERAEKAARKRDAKAAKRKLREAKVDSALRYGARLKAERAREREAESQKAAEKKAARERLIDLLVGARR